jgi:hypothetical protein
MIDARRQVVRHLSMNELITNYKKVKTSLLANSIGRKDNFTRFDHKFFDDRTVYVDDSILDQYVKEKTRIEPGIINLPEKVKFDIMINHEFKKFLFKKKNDYITYMYLYSYLVKFSLNDFYEGMGEMPPFEFKTNPQDAQTYKPYLPFQIVLCPVSDKGRIMQLIETIPGFRRKKIGDKLVHYKIIETKYSELSNLQLDFIKKLSHSYKIYSKTQTFEELLQVKNKSFRMIIHPFLKCEAQIKRNYKKEMDLYIKHKLLKDRYVEVIQPKEGIFKHDNVKREIVRVVIKPKTPNDYLYYAIYRCKSRAKPFATNKGRVSYIIKDKNIDFKPVDYEKMKFKFIGYHKYVPQDLIKIVNESEAKQEGILHTINLADIKVLNEPNN